MNSPHVAEDKAARRARLATDRLQEARLGLQPLNLESYASEGLTQEEVALRVQLRLTNAVSSSSSRSIASILRANLFTLFNAVVGGSFIVLLFLGQWRDAIFGVIVIANIGIGVVQEFRSKRTLDRLAKNAEGYPPYNIERVGDNGLRIVLAVAGFTIDDLAIELVESQLTVRGKQTDDGDRVFLHRGIAARQFQRAFMLADGIEVMGARLDNGLLSIDLVRPAAEPRIRTIRIDSGETATEANNAIDITARRSGSR